MRLTEDYAARSVRYLELWEWDGWRVKVYGLAYRGDKPSDELIAAAKVAAQQCLPVPAITTDRYGVGFIGVHEGRGGNLVFVDWWSNENELRHHSFLAAEESPTVLCEATSDGLAGCVWDLAVIGFERDAWIASVLLDASTPDLDRYLDSRFQGVV